MGESSEFQYTNLDEFLINLVKERPALYDLRVPPKDRTKISKQALWYEISKCMQGQLEPEAAEARWKYLRENFLKARKKLKVKEDIAKQTGTPLQSSSKNRKYSFRYYETMEFLIDSLDYQKMLTLNNITKTKIKHCTMMKDQKLQQTTVNPLIKMIPSVHVNTHPVSSVDNFEEVDIDAEPNSPSSQQTLDYENNLNFKNNHINNYDQIFLECLQKPIEKPSPIDGFLIRLGEGLKRLPYRERSKLELEFLSRLHEVEEQLEIYDEN